MSQPVTVNLRPTINRIVLSSVSRKLPQQINGNHQIKKAFCWRLVSRDTSSPAHNQIIYLDICIPVATRFRNSQVSCSSRFSWYLEKLGLLWLWKVFQSVFIYITIMFPGIWSLNCYWMDAILPNNAASNPETKKKDTILLISKPRAVFFKNIWAV